MATPWVATNRWAWSTRCVGMSARPSPCTRTSKYHGGRRSGTPFTTFSRWCTLASLMAGPSSPVANSPKMSRSPTSRLAMLDVAGVASGHHLHDPRAPAQHMTDVGQGGGAREPGLVGQHVERGVVQPSREGHLAIVAAGQDHDVAGPIVQERRERIVARPDDRLPRRWPLGPTIERLDQRQELGKLSAAAGPVGGRCVHHDLVAHERMALAQRERGVEMPGVQKYERVHREPRPAPTVVGTWTAAPVYRASRWRDRTSVAVVTYGLRRRTPWRAR